MSQGDGFDDARLDYRLVERVDEGLHFLVMLLLESLITVVNDQAQSAAHPWRRRGG